MKEEVTQFIVALAKDDYKAANKIFPKVISATIKNCINKRKEAVIKEINKDASSLVSKSVLEKSE